MGILSGIFRLVDDIVSIPTDVVGLTNHYGKKKAREKVERMLDRGEINGEQYVEIIRLIEKQ